MSLPRSFRIRFAKPGERAALEALQWRASLVWEEYRAALLAHPDAIALPDEWITRRRVRVAESAEGILGFSLAIAEPPGVEELDGLFVEPQWMRQGVGRRLIEDVVRRARRSGARALLVIGNPGRGHQGLGALIVTNGVGALSAINGVAGAYSEHVPVVCICGSLPARAIQRGDLMHHTLD